MFAVCTRPATTTYLDLNWRFVFAISLVSYAGKGFFDNSRKTRATFSSLYTLAQLNTSLPHVLQSSRAHCASSSATDFSLVMHSMPFIQSQIPLLFQPHHRTSRIWIWKEHQQGIWIFIFYYYYFIPATFIKWFPERASRDNRQQRCHSGLQSSCLAWACRALVLDPLGKIAFGCESHSLLSASHSCEGYK